MLLAAHIDMRAVDIVAAGYLFYLGGNFPHIARGEDGGKGPVLPVDAALCQLGRWYAVHHASAARDPECGQVSGQFSIEGRIIIPWQYGPVPVTILCQSAMARRQSRTPPFGGSRLIPTGCAIDPIKSVKQGKTKRDRNRADRIFREDLNCHLLVDKSPLLTPEQRTAFRTQPMCW